MDAGIADRLGSDETHGLPGSFGGDPCAPIEASTDERVMTIGVVIPVWNRRRLVTEALDSVLAQTRQPARVVVVDDGSTDGTGESVREWLRRHGEPEGWSVIEAEHRGAGHARNVGLGAIGNCACVAFFDSDDLWPTDFLSRAAEAFEREPALVGVSSDRLTLDFRAETQKHDDTAGLSGEPLRWMLLHGAGFGSCSVVSTEMVRTTGGYPTEELTGHDIVLFTRLFARGRWGHLPGEPVVFRRNHTSAYREQDHIHRTVDDANARWTRLMEEAFGELARVGDPPREVRRAMARRWISVAKDCHKRGDRAEGLACLRRSRAHARVSVRRVRWRVRLALMRESKTMQGSLS